MDRCSSMQGDFHLNGEIEILTHTVEARTIYVGKSDIPPEKYV